MTEINAEMLTIDTRGRVCPAPVLLTKKGLEKINSGQMLEVIATDSAAQSDIPVFVKKLGHELVEVKQVEGLLHFFIRKK